MSVWQLSLLHLTVNKLPHFFVIVYNGVVSKTYLTQVFISRVGHSSLHISFSTYFLPRQLGPVVNTSLDCRIWKHLVQHTPQSLLIEGCDLPDSWCSGQNINDFLQHLQTHFNAQLYFLFTLRERTHFAGILLGLPNTGVEYNDHYSRETLYLSRQGLWLEKQTIDNTTQTIPLALITIEATCPRKRKCYTMTPLQSDSRELSIINQFGSPANGGDSEKN